MTIECLVLSGGGPLGFIQLGELYYLETQKKWNIDDIKSIYATSVGAIIAVILSLKLDWEIINDYLIKRPWEKVFKIDSDQVIHFFANKGVFDEKLLTEVLKPLFEIKDISLDVTMKEFYEMVNKELFFYSLNLNNSQTEEISYLTFPNIPLVKALTMTSSVPIFFMPTQIDNQFYIDGGVDNNYPIYNALQKYTIDNILGFKFIYKNKHVELFLDKVDLLHYLYILFEYLLKRNDGNNKTIINQYQEIVFEYNEEIQLNNVIDCIHSTEKRQTLFDIGMNNGKEFTTLYNKTESK